MESLKNVVGLGDAQTTTARNETKGQEPLSGVSGPGTADQPYDSGNAEDPHLADDSAASAKSNGRDLATPLKSLAAPGAVLASLASAVGLQSSTTSVNATTSELQGQEPVSGMTGEGTADQPYDAGNADGQPLGGNAVEGSSQSAGLDSTEQSERAGSSGPFDMAAGEDDPAKSDQGLQLVGIAHAANTSSSDKQTHGSISQAVGEGALWSDRDPAKSDHGLAFITSAKGKQPTEDLQPKTSNHAPLPGTEGAYTKKDTLATNGSSNEPAGEPDIVIHVEPLKDGAEESSIEGAATVSSLFGDPFAKRDSISGAATEMDLDPKTAAPAGSEPMPELTEHAVPIRVAKEKRPLPTQSSAASTSPASRDPKPAVVEPKADLAIRPPHHLGADVPPGAASPKRDKGKGKVYGDSDTNSTRSSLTRTTSVGTTQTAPSTVDSRKFSPRVDGRIPTAGGIVLGEKAAKERERRARQAQSHHSSAPSDIAYGNHDSLQKVNEDPEMATSLTALPPVPASHRSTPRDSLANESPSSLQKSTTKGSNNTASGRVPCTEKGTLNTVLSASWDGSRFAEQGLVNSTTGPDTAASQTTEDRKPSLVSRIGRKLTNMSSAKTSK